jgi:hypothetical protein
MLLSTDAAATSRNIMLKNWNMRLVFSPRYSCYKVVEIHRAAYSNPQNPKKSKFGAINLVIFKNFVGTGF